MIGISSCLGGICCRYDGKSQEQEALKQLVTNGKAIMICPEVLGELPIPRPPAEIIGGGGFCVLGEIAFLYKGKGGEVTGAVKAGAQRAYQKLKTQQITTLILKEKSPSCGSQLIYDGQFSGIKKAGVGVATAYFIQQGMTVYSEETWQLADISF